MLELAFESLKLRTICEGPTEAEAEFGPEVAESLRHRLADMRAATSIHDLLAGQPHALEPTELQQMAVALDHGYRLIFCANHVNNPKAESGRVDWKRVSRIKIMRIERDHD